MARPRVPISRTDYYVRGPAVASGGLSPFGVDEDYRPLSSFKVQDEIASSLTHLWLAQGQHYVNFLTPSAGTPISFTGDDTANKAGNGAFTFLRSWSWVCRVLPDGRPEPVRVVIRAKKASGGDPDFYVRAVLRPYNIEPLSPWPLPADGLHPGWNVGQAVFTSSSLAETEIDSTHGGFDMKGIMQIHPTGLAAAQARTTFQRQAGIGTHDDWESVAVPMLTLDLFGGFVSGPSGTPEVWGVLARAAPYGVALSTGLDT